MTDITHEWIAKREELIAWFSKPFRDMPQDKVGLSILATNDFPRALAALKAVLELHRLNREVDGDCQGYTSSGYGYLDRWCVECSDQLCREYGTPWPCPTVRAVDAALRGES